MSSNGDNHTPHADGKWHFDQSVTDNFDAMLSASIPGYQDMRKVISNLGARILTKSKIRVPTLIDWGASRGNAFMDVLSSFLNVRDAADHSGLTVHALEIAEPMLEVLHQRQAELVELSRETHSRLRVHPTQFDMRSLAQPHMYPQQMVVPAADLHLCVLTLQFVPTEYRTQIAKCWHSTLRQEGALLLVEKVTSSNAMIHSMLIEEYHDHKERFGYSPKDIDTKRRSLENSLVALTESGNVELLRGAGFTHVECVWRNLNFVAWMAVKE